MKHIVGVILAATVLSGCSGSMKTSSLLRGHQESQTVVVVSDRPAPFEGSQCGVSYTSKSRQLETVVRVYRWSDDQWTFAEEQQIKGSERPGGSYSSIHINGITDGTPGDKDNVILGADFGVEVASLANGRFLETTIDGDFSRLVDLKDENTGNGLHAETPIVEKGRIYAGVSFPLSVGYTHKVFSTAKKGRVEIFQCVTSSDKA